MIYNYKSNETVQDVILECYCPLLNDIADEYSTLRREDSLFIYAPSYVAREILARLLEEIEDVWVHAESHSELLYNDENEVVITVASDGMIFVEGARCEDGKLKDNDEFSLTYVYDGFSKRDIDELSASGKSILVFGFEDEDMVCDEDDEECKSKSKCDECNEDENTECTVKSDDDGYSITVRCNLDADEAMKVIKDMENRMERMNDMFREMDYFRRLLKF